MAPATPKIALNGSRDIPFDKLVLSQSNVRRTKAGVSIKELAEDIARRRKLIQSLSVRPVLDGEGQETGMYEVPAGGRRFRALELLVKQKRLPKTAPIPCVVSAADNAISPEDDSLAENTMRAALHPLDQFRAFLTLREERGMSDEEIAAAFFVTPQVVKQRLKLTAVSPKLLNLYAEDAITLEQLMAFTVTGDHVRQEQVWEAIQRGYNKEPYLIRRMLTEDKVPAGERRAAFVSAEAYEAAGGTVARDLFHQDGGGWFEDVPLLDRLVDEKLKAEADAVAAEGWKWVEVARDFPWGHTQGLRRVLATVEPLTPDEEARLAGFRAEMQRLEDEHNGTGEDLPEEVDQRLYELEREILALDTRPGRYDPEEVARAGAYVSLSHEGHVRIERGYVRPEDEEPVATTGDGEGGSEAATPTGSEPASVGRVTFAGAAPAGTGATEPEDEGDRPLTERLMTELTTYRTMALRNALAGGPDAAFLAVLHAMVLRVFGPSYGNDSCLELQLKLTPPDRSVPGLAEAPAAVALIARKEAWAERVPGQPKQMWDFLLGLDGDSRADLFALCAGFAVNAMHLPYDRRPDAIAHADRVAELVGLDMSEHWRPTADNFFARVTKGRILSAVREAKGEASAQLIDHLKKADMAREAERLLDGTGWLPEPLRTPGLGDLLDPATAPDIPGADTGPELPAFLAEEDGDGEPSTEPVHSIAAE